MNREEFESLRRNDIVRHVSSGNAFIVKDITPVGYIATRRMNVTNPDEWELAERSGASIFNTLDGRKLIMPVCAGLAIAGIPIVSQIATYLLMGMIALVAAIRTGDMYRRVMLALKGSRSQIEEYINKYMVSRDSELALWCGVFTLAFLAAGGMWWWFAISVYSIAGYSLSAAMLRVARDEWSQLNDAIDVMQN